MSRIIIDPKELEQLARLDAKICSLNNEKIKLIFDLIGMQIAPAELEKLLDWPLILVYVPDRQMAVQLNKLAAYIPNLKFVVDVNQPLFLVAQGSKGRRVWKER